MTPEKLLEIIDKIGSPFNIVDSRFEKGDIKGHVYYAKQELQKEFAYLSSASLIYSYELFKAEEIFELDKDDVTPLELVNLEHLYSFLTQSRYYIIEKTANDKMKSLNDKKLYSHDYLMTAVKTTFSNNSLYERYDKKLTDNPNNAKKLVYLSDITKILNIYEIDDEKIILSEMIKEGNNINHRIRSFNYRNELLFDVRRVNYVMAYALKKCFQETDMSESLKYAFIFTILRGHNTRSHRGACWAMEQSLRWVFLQKGWPQFRKIDGLVMEAEIVFESLRMSDNPESLKAGFDNHTINSFFEKLVQDYQISLTSPPDNSYFMTPRIVKEDKQRLNIDYKDIIEYFTQIELDFKKTLNDAITQNSLFYPQILLKLNIFQQNILHYFILKGYDVNLIKLLIDNNPQEILEKTDIFGNNALHYACIVNNTELIKHLLTKYVNPFALNFNVETAIDICKKHNNNEAITLLEEIPDTNKIFFEKLFIIKRQINLNFLLNIRLLYIKKDDGINILNYLILERFAPLQNIFRNISHQYLIMNKKHLINRQDGNGNTPLQIATRINDAEAIEFLLENGAKPKITNDTVATEIEIVKPPKIEEILDPITKDTRNDIFDTIENHGRNKIIKHFNNKDYLTNQLIAVIKTKNIDTLETAIKEIQKLIASNPNMEDIVSDLCNDKLMIKEITQTIKEIIPLEHRPRFVHLLQQFGLKLENIDFLKIKDFDLVSEIIIGCNISEFQTILNEVDHDGYNIFYHLEKSYHEADPSTQIKILDTYYRIVEKCQDHSMLNLRDIFINSQQAINDLGIGKQISAIFCVSIDQQDLKLIENLAEFGSDLTAIDKDSKNFLHILASSQNFLHLRTLFFPNKDEQEKYPIITEFVRNNAKSLLCSVDKKQRDIIYYLEQNEFQSLNKIFKDTLDLDDEEITIIDRFEENEYKEDSNATEINKLIQDLKNKKLEYPQTSIRDPETTNQKTRVL